MKKVIPVLEEQVSLIMTLGRVVYLFSSYGPPGPGERFAEHMVDKIPNMESDFRKTNDFEKLAEDLWYIRCVAAQYDKYVREFTKERHPDLSHIVNHGHSPAEGCDIKGEYTFNHCPYAGELGEFPTYGLRMADGEWKDPHEGWKDLYLYDEVKKLIPQNWLE